MEPDAAQQKTYGAEDPAFTLTASGFVDGDDVSILTGSLGREAGQDVGTYAFTLGDLSAGSDYVLELSATAATFAIEPAPLAIAPDAGQSKLVGDDDPTITYVASGFQLDDDDAILSGDLGREAGEDVGSYAYTLGSLDAGANYELVLADDEQFEITSVTLDDDTVEYDGTTHELEASFMPPEAADGATYEYVDASSGNPLAGCAGRRGHVPRDGHRRFGLRRYCNRQPDDRAA
ncbi:MAG: MBG domain-containing protein [Trueperaceae bacterium]|nr:MBG domain-containing protein [Trueperaceae bacterium]